MRIKRTDMSVSMSVSEIPMDSPEREERDKILDEESMISYVQSQDNPPEKHSPPRIESARQPIT